MNRQRRFCCVHGHWQGSTLWFYILNVHHRLTKGSDCSQETSASIPSLFRQAVLPVQSHTLVALRVGWKLAL